MLPSQIRPNGNRAEYGRGVAAVSCQGRGKTKVGGCLIFDEEIERDDDVKKKTRKILVAALCEARHESTK